MTTSTDTQTLEIVTKEIGQPTTLTFKNGNQYFAPVAKAVVAGVLLTATGTGSVNSSLSTNLGVPDMHFSSTLSHSFLVTAPARQVEEFLVDRSYMEEDAVLSPELIGVHVSAEALERVLATPTDSYYFMEEE